MIPAHRQMPSPSSAERLGSMVTEPSSGWSGGDRSTHSTDPASQPAVEIRILVIDDSRLYSQALADVLRQEPWVDQIETADDDFAATMRSCAQASTVTLLNMATEGSLGLLRGLSDAGARVVVLGIHETEADIVSCAEAGSAGYVFRGDSLASLRMVIHAVARGETICSPKATAALLRRVAFLAAERRRRDALLLLTAREAEILGLIEAGMTNKQIAATLCIELPTVKNHVHAILGKLGVERRGQAAARARVGRASTAWV